MAAAALHARTSATNTNLAAYSEATLVGVIFTQYSAQGGNNRRRRDVFGSSLLPWHHPRVVKDLAKRVPKAIPWRETHFPKDELSWSSRHVRTLAPALPRELDTLRLCNWTPDAHYIETEQAGALTAPSRRGARVRPGTGKLGCVCTCVGNKHKPFFQQL